MKTLLPIALLSLITLTSCGTLFNPGPDQIAVTSIPPDALVFLDGAPTGFSTPCSLTVKRSCKGMITVKKDGYQDATMKIGTDFNGPTILNIFFGYISPLFFLVDIAGGNASTRSSIPTFNMAKIGDAPWMPPTKKAAKKANENKTIYWKNPNKEKSNDK